MASTPVVVLSTILGRTLTMDEYKFALGGINLTKLSPPLIKITQSVIRTISGHFAGVLSWSVRLWQGARLAQSGGQNNCWDRGLNLWETVGTALYGRAE